MDLKDASTLKELPCYSMFISKQITHFKLKSTITMLLARMSNLKKELSLLHSVRFFQSKPKSGKSEAIGVPCKSDDEATSRPSKWKHRQEWKVDGSLLAKRMMALISLRPSAHR
ncbi:hypothetical protein K0M31_016905 [Melipona bicolor]|uniref:Uncharacterized protein n=1 Tax=Melipona bicolor TaxID=60889 RepID=A0AA40KEB4_9HYME|nr:hypothetical protein K0M31_016905 [Melipona bicolor]